MKVIIVLLYLVSTVLFIVAAGIKLEYISSLKDYYRIATVLGGFFLAVASFAYFIMNR